MFASATAGVLVMLMTTNSRPSGFQLGIRQSAITAMGAKSATNSMGAKGAMSAKGACHGCQGVPRPMTSRGSNYYETYTRNYSG